MPGGLYQGRLTVVQNSFGPNDDGCKKARSLQYYYGRAPSMINDVILLRTLKGPFD